MKFLIIATVLVGACFAQGPQPRRLVQQNEDDFQPQQQPNNFQSPPQKQYQDKQPAQARYEATTYIPIIRFDKEQGEAGSYKQLWETGNNILAQEEGFLKDLGPDPDSKSGETLHAQVQQGSYEYTAPNGEIIRTVYTADENGFHVQGDHLPTPPPVSPEVQKGLDLIFAGIKQQQEQEQREYTSASEQKQQIRKNPANQEYNANYRQQ